MTFFAHTTSFPHINPHLQDSELASAIAVGAVLLLVAAALHLWHMSSEHPIKAEPPKNQLACTHCQRTFSKVSEYLEHLEKPGFCAEPVSEFQTRRN